LTTQFSVVDEAKNRAFFTLTTMVVDTQAPVLKYTSNYNQTDMSATHVIETVEASRQDNYELGTLSAMDPPLMQMLEVALLGLANPVDRGRKNIACHNTK
jgi:hypothetical protein